jgi:hypothetical protein
LLNEQELVFETGRELDREYVRACGQSPKLSLLENGLSLPLCIAHLHPTIKTHGFLCRGGIACRFSFWLVLQDRQYPSRNGGSYFRDRRV